MLTNTIAKSDAAPAPVLNQALLEQYRTRKNNLLERLINAYLEEAPSFFQNIRKAAESRDLHAVRENAHALKSCSGNLGAARLSAVCQQLESAASAQNADAVADMLSRVGPECFEAEQALRGELYKLKQPGSEAKPAPQPTNWE